MFEPIKQLIINKLIEEVTLIDPTSIELIGNNVVSIIESKRLIHHGINKNYKPSGYTVDSFSNDSTIVVEYSTEKNYFFDSSPKGVTQPIYTKITKDINHAVKHNLPNGPTKIYLISTEEEPSSFRAKFNTTPIAKSQGLKTIIYDARELAKLIYEQSIKNPTYADFYRQFFPGFSQNLDNYEYYGVVPAQCEQYTSEPLVLQAINNHFELGKDICVLYGVSGVGKTQATIDYVHSENTNYENILWISGDDWLKDTSLRSIRRSRGGTPVNVAGLFNASKTLLVIDSLERTLAIAQLAELEVGFTKGSRILSTSQISNVGNEFYLQTPTLSEDVAIQILGEDTVNPSQRGKEVALACSFSPLILSTIRSLIDIEEIPQNELYTEVLSDPDAITGEDGLSIMARILNKLNPKMMEALKKIANSGSYQHDSNFLNHYLGILNRNSLQKLSILLQTNIPGILKMHDLIAKSIQDNLNSADISSAIESYINKYYGEMSPSVLREVHICYKQLCEEEIRRGEREPDWISYALLQLEGEAKENVYKKIFDKEIMQIESLAALMSVIDAKEIHSYTIKDKDEKSSYYESCAKEYHKGFEVFTNEDMKAELLHHQGKALRRCGKFDESLECFDQLLKLKNWHATYGQIAHLGTQYGVDKKIKERGEEAMRQLITFILEDSSSVPLRVSLAAFARLRSYYELKKAIESNPENVNILGNIIAMSALEGLDQFYEAYVSFTSLFGYTNSATCVELAESLPEMLAMPPEAIDKYQWVSACEALTNTAIAAQRSAKMELSKQMILASIAYADKISQKNKLGSYEARAIAKAYVAAGKPQDALDAIAKVAENDVNHWLLYQKAEALLKLGSFSDALDTISKALELAIKDTKAKYSLSSYYDLKCQCYEKLGKVTNALEELHFAIKHCSTEKYKFSLEQKLLQLSQK